jgi:hypothetical protein
MSSRVKARLTGTPSDQAVAAARKEENAGERAGLILHDHLLRRRPPPTAHAKKAPRERGLSRRNVERENRTCGIDRHETASFAAALAM